MEMSSSLLLDVWTWNFIETAVTLILLELKESGQFWTLCGFSVLVLLGAKGIFEQQFSADDVVVFYNSIYVFFLNEIKGNK